MIIFSTYYFQFHAGFVHSVLGLGSHFFRLYCWMDLFYSEFFVHNNVLIDWGVDATTAPRMRIGILLGKLGLE